jgi:hypothetical protein
MEVTRQASCFQYISVGSEETPSINKVGLHVGLDQQEHLNRKPLKRVYSIGRRKIS